MPAVMQFPLTYRPLEFPFMAASNKKTAAAKSVAAPQPEASFVELMLVTADFIKSCGGVDHAKKSLDDAGRFIVHAGGVANATKALEVLASLKAKITD